jgi:diaminopimelate decarboxylase
LTRILYRKRVHDKNFVVVDAGMNDLLRPSLYGACHRILPAQERLGTEKVDVVGPICENADFIAKDYPLPLVEPGELLAVLDTGAYGFVMSSQYNSRPRAAEVLLLWGTPHPVRRRETWDDLWRGEEVPPCLT